LAESAAGDKDALLGGGARLFDGVGPPGLRLDLVRAVEAPGVAHLKYRVVT
jgi:hypothetical protein